MLAKLDFCNMALGFLGTRTIHQAELDNSSSPEAIQCNLYWDRARRTALRDFPYRFAQRRFLLEEVVMPVLYAGQWRYAYKLPECLKVVRIHNGFDRIGRTPFAIEKVDGDMLVFCNIPNAQATCTVDEEDVSKWDELFISMMAKKLAALIFPALYARREVGTGGTKQA